MRADVAPAPRLCGREATITRDEGTRIRLRAAVGRADGSAGSRRRRERAARSESRLFARDRNSTKPHATGAGFALDGEPAPDDLRTAQARIMQWFKPLGPSFYPASAMGWIVTLAALAFCAHIFLFVDHRSHSVTDTLHGIFPYWAPALLALAWIADRTGGRSAQGVPPIRA